MAAHSSVLPWRIPGMAEPGGLPSMGSHRVGHDWSDIAAAAAAVIPNHQPQFLITVRSEPKIICRLFSLSSKVSTESSSQSCSEFKRSPNHVYSSHRWGTVLSLRLSHDPGSEILPISCWFRSTTHSVGLVKKFVQVAYGKIQMNFLANPIN